MPLFVGFHTWNRRAVLFVAFLATFVCSTMVAHDYWFEWDGAHFILYQGHKHSSHSGEERVPYALEIVKRVQCIDSGGGSKELPLSKNYPLRLDAKCAALSVHLSSGYWSQTLMGTVNKPRSEVSGALRGWRSEEAIKYLHAWSPRLLAPITQDLELVPSTNLLLLKSGEKIRLTAMWEGKPRAGVVVAYDGKTRGVTGDDGQINIRVGHDGLQTISASFEQPLQDPNADKVVHSTILQFQINQQGELK